MLRLIVQGLLLAAGLAGAAVGLPRLMGIHAVPDALTVALVACGAIGFAWLQLTPQRR